MHEILIPRKSQNRSVIVLAGGDGMRLRDFVKRLRGDHLPKQYVDFLGTGSLLQATLGRAAHLVSQEHQYVVVTEHHFDYPEVAKQLAVLSKAQVAIQPSNRDTGLGLILALAHLYKRNPNATVVMFPSDHFIEEEGRFLTHVDAACRFVESDPSKIVLLGIAAHTPETEYGYIVTTNRWHNALPYGCRDVSRFIEKPDETSARQLILRGALWNTMVMIFKITTLLGHIKAIRPTAHRDFEQIEQAIDTSEENTVVRQVFRHAPPLNLSKGIIQSLATQDPPSLVVLPVRGVHWSDWGSETRVTNSLVHKQECPTNFRAIDQSAIRYPVQACLAPIKI
jgi:mannose-1-phosphate guanylyltransferase